MGDKPFGLKMRITLRLAFTFVCASVLAACATTERRVTLSDFPGSESLIVLAQPPIIEARTDQDLGLVQLQATRLDPASLAARSDARRSGIEALPYLTNSEAGQKFLGLASPRAISRGSPPELCPAVGVAGGGGAGSPAAAAVASMAACLGALETAPEICGCRLLALDGILTVPQTEMSYAVGTSARLRSTALGLDILIVAEDLGGGVTLLRDLSGPVGVLRHMPDGKVELTLLGEEGQVFTGESRSVGFRRGRLAERIHASDGAGRGVALLIGFSPEELASHAGAWLAAPPKG